jgi:hypothetical protein
MPATAFAARISMDSPGRILSLATASASLARLEIDGGRARHFRDRQPGALAHRDHGLAAQQHARDRLIAVSLTKTSSLNWSGCGASVTRVTVT